MMYNIFHGYDYGIINYIYNFFKNIFDYIQISKAQFKGFKMSQNRVFQYVFHPTKKKEKLTTYLNTRSIGSGWG